MTKLRGSEHLRKAQRESTTWNEMPNSLWAGDGANVRHTVRALTNAANDQARETIRITLKSFLNCLIAYLTDKNVDAAPFDDEATDGSKAHKKIAYVKICATAVIDCFQLETLRLGEALQKAEAERIATERKKFEEELVRKVGDVRERAFRMLTTPDGQDIIAADPSIFKTFRKVLDELRKEGAPAHAVQNVKADIALAYRDTRRFHEQNIRPGDHIAEVLERFRQKRLARFQFPHRPLKWF